MNCCHLTYNKEVFNNPQFMFISYDVLRKLSMFRRELYCVHFAIVAVYMNVETLKENGILLSQFAQNVVEVFF